MVDFHLQDFLLVVLGDDIQEDEHGQDQVERDEVVHDVPNGEEVDEEDQVGDVEVEHELVKGLGGLHVVEEDEQQHEENESWVEVEGEAVVVVDCQILLQAEERNVAVLQQSLRTHVPRKQQRKRKLNYDQSHRQVAQIDRREKEVATAQRHFN